MSILTNSKLLVLFYRLARPLVSKKEEKKKNLGEKKARHFKFMWLHLGVHTTWHSEFTHGHLQRHFTALSLNSTVLIRYRAGLSRVSESFSGISRFELW